MSMLSVTHKAPMLYFGSPEGHPEYAPSTRLMSGIASMAISPVNERMWCTWYGGKTKGEDHNNYVILSTSCDHGKTWKEVLIADPDGEGPWRYFDPCLWVTPEGKLWWTFVGRPVDQCEVEKAAAKETVANDLLLRVELNAEEEPVDPKYEVILDGAGVMMCKPTVFRDGTWALPIAGWYSDDSIRMYVTSDKGKTFSLRGKGSIFPKEDRICDEEMFVEKANGDIDAYVRVKSGVRIGTSHDCGRTWSNFEPASFKHPSSRLFVRRLKSGNLLMVKHGKLDYDSQERTNLMAFISKDDGKTWEGGLLLDSRPWISYPDGDEFQDGTIAICYDFARYDSDQHIYFATFTEADALAGRNVSGKVTLRNLISAVRWREECTSRPDPEQTPWSDTILSVPRPDLL